jgi:hypothetical protein
VARTYAENDIFYELETKLTTMFLVSQTTIFEQHQALPASPFTPADQVERLPWA